MNHLNKHIVIVSSEFPPQPGGIGNHAFNLALYLTKAHYEVSVITDQRSISGADEHNFDRAQPFSVYRVKRYSFRIIMYLRRIIKTYKSLKKADYVIATGKFSLWNVAFLSLFRKVKSIAVIHGTEVNFKPTLLRKSIDFALKRMDHIIAVSHYTKTLISHLNLEVSVIPNGINLESWTKNELTEIELKGHPTLTTVGRVSSRKGQLNVIKQLPELINKFPNIHYHCVGIPTEAHNFFNIAKQHKVETHITFHGNVDQKHLQHILKATDIFVMLSSESKTGDVEGFGIAILEANALGIPAIGSKGCGIEDAIDDKTSGVLIESNNPKALINAIELINNNTLRFKKEARNWAKSHDWSHIILPYTELLN
ncbi:glycosyltransferase family 4 protein [Ichthyenterobacterium sp. W332]|uniref:Glycosyltransferase family 4 protein n=1 Tax=Microcosmobacter mediterraneus TaxID=3075607 RepID=A0ABU2YGR0_9FLAO|nr:glycosyltransferase family 4 protein [Ichthyenterobacterium sp. W332]MDT0557363.1 glycosyltransferase family 4 protein [Ichthyenterobacterium sp. W332]